MQKSFMNIPWVWMKKTGVDKWEDDVVKLLIGNKSDCQAERQINYTRGKVILTLERVKFRNAYIDVLLFSKEFAERQGFLFAEASAKDGSNVKEAFMKITTEIMNKLDPQVIDIKL
jgi:GTPase SAR1 family protein